MNKSSEQIELRQAENNLRASEYLYSNLVNGIKDYAIIMLDPNGYIVSWNQGAERIKGYQVEEIIGQHFSKFYTQDNLDKGKPDTELLVAKTEGRFEEESWRVRKDGSLFMANVVIRPLYDEEGQLKGYSKITRDITERKRAENALKASELRFTTLVDNVKDYAIFILDPNGYITSWNIGAERIKGYEAEEIIGRHFSKLYTQDDLDQGKPEAELLIAKTEGRFEVESWRVRKDDSKFIANVIISPLYDDCCQLNGYCNITRDITARILAEQQLQTSANYARSLVEASLDPLITISAQGNIMDVNKAAELMTGVKRNQLIGSDFCGYFTEPKQARVAYMQAFSQGSISDYALIMRHRSGKITEVFFNANVFQDQYGAVVGVLALARDVTKTKQIEDELRQLNNDLENFSYCVSHDLRAPLRAIHGFTTILSEEYATILDEEGQRLFKIVSDNAKKMGQLIDDILFLSRANRLEMQLNFIDMKMLAQEVWNELAADRVGRTIDFRLMDLPVACADTTAIREVLQNLLSNAIKFTRGCDSALIELTGYKNGIENVYSVQDNGVGFDMQYSNKLFGLFQRLHSMTEFEGTGVGLAIVKRFIIKHGGRVWAVSKPNQGATFCFTLPPETNCNQFKDFDNE